MASPALINWVHPSVRDTVIDYLADHDADRAQFLSTASASGVLLALSTAGGAKGSRVVPLLRTETDSAALEDTVLRHAHSGHLAAQEVLLRGFHEALLASEHLEDEDVRRIRRTAEKFLFALYEDWRAAAPILPVTALRLYYELSVALRCMVPSPPLMASWRDSADRLDQLTQGELREIDLDVVERFAALVELLQLNEPRFLRMLDVHAELEERTAGLCDALKDELGRLDPLNPDEVEGFESDEGEWVDRPVEPSSEEASERRWLATVVEVVGALRQLQASHVADFTQVEELAVRALETRETRQERFREWESSVAEDDEWWDTARDQGSGDFDLVEFFADL